jgi:hypothetical protein
MYVSCGLRYLNSGESSRFSSLLAGVLALVASSCQLKLIGASTSGEGTTQSTTATLSISEPSIPTAAWGSPVDVTYTATNRGSSAATSLSVSGLATPFSRVGGTCATSLAAGESCTIILRFDPPGEGTWNDTLEVAYLNASGAQEATRDVSATGQAATAFSVAPLYPPGPGQKARWNYWIRINDATADVYHQAGIACAGTESGFGCTHEGDRLEVTTPFTSCTGLTAADELDSFNWICAIDGGVAKIFAKDIKPGKGLSDLITPTAFKPNFVKLSQSGILFAKTLPDTWWSNSFATPAANPLDTQAAVNLGSQGTIYTIDTSTTSSGYVISANNVSLVVMPTRTLTYSGRATQACFAGGSRCLTGTSSGVNFAWIEGSLSGDSPTNDAENLVALNNSRYSVVNRVTLTGATNEAVYVNNNLTLEGNSIIANATASGNYGVVEFDASGYNGLAYVTSTGSAGEGITLQNGAHHNVIVEAAISSVAGTGNGLWLNDADHNLIVKSAFAGNGGDGIELQGASTDNGLEEITVTSNGGNGIHSWNTAHRNYFSQVKASLNVDDGLNLNGDDYYVVGSTTSANGGAGLWTSGNRPKVIDLVTTSNVAPGIYDQSIDGTFVKIVSIGNRDGISMAGGRSTVSHVTVLNPQSRMYYINMVAIPNAAQTINQFLGANGRGFWSQSSTGGFRVSQFAISLFDNSGGIDLEAATPNTFIENLLVGSVTGLNERCNTTVGNGGLIDGTCTDTGLDGSNVYTGQAGTTASFRSTTVDFTSSFVGKVLADDSTNTSDAAGSALIGAITDWTAFENRYRGWGQSGGAFPASANRGPCVAGTCTIWDTRLRSSDTVVLNRSGNGTAPNSAFVAGAACPSAVDGNRVITDQQATPQTFLVNAVETLSDTIGDDDGLCESNEACIYSPNFGAYQGSGALVGPCTFTGGAVTGVTMMAHAINGE